MLHAFERNVNKVRGSMILDVIFGVLNCERQRIVGCFCRRAR